MTKLLVLSALALLCSAQSTTPETGINPSDIAELPSASAMAPPAGTQSATISYDSAAAKSSIEAVVSSGADAQSSSSAPNVPVITLTESPTFPLASIPTHAVKRNIDISRMFKRDLPYPIDTRNVPVPSGYTPAFASLNGSTQAKGYLTYKTQTTYDPAQCAASCNKISTCQFFNIYYEKDPDNNGNPVDVIKCALYSMPQTKATATNYGQWRGNFHVIITGSNGYNKAAAPVAPAGYSLAGLDGAVEPPANDRINQVTFLQAIYLDKYDPALCAAACDKQTELNKAAATDCNYQTCVYANLYILSEDGVPQTTVCALYTQGWDAYATKKSYDTGVHHYDVSNSIGLTNFAAAQVYPKLCVTEDPCAGVKGNCYIGEFKLLGWGGTNRYNGFYGDNQEGALLRGSSTEISPDSTIVFQGTGQVNSGFGLEIGYVIHPKSGLCLTLQNPTTPEGRMLLTPCATSELPPDNQKFMHLYYSPWMNFHCVTGYTDNLILAQTDNFPAGQTAISTWYNNGGWCVHITPTA